LLEQVILAGLALHPSLIGEFSDLLEAGHWTRDEHLWLAQVLIALEPQIGAEAARITIDERLGHEALEILLAQRHVRISPLTRTDVDGARMCIRDALARLDARRGADRERREAIEDFEDGADEAMTWRLAQAGRLRDNSQRMARSDDLDGADEVGLSTYLQDLLDTKVWEKAKKK
jgi:DNA primase